VVTGEVEDGVMEEVAMAAMGILILNKAVRI
jgi:hypothetical protein